MTPPTVSAVLEDAQSTRFEAYEINSTGSALKKPFFRRNDACDPLQLSLADLRSRRPKRGASSSPAQPVLRGTSPGNRYQKATEDQIDLIIMWMEDDHLVDIAEKLKRPRVLREFTKNPNASQCYGQLVAWITRQHDLATYLQVVDPSLASTTSTQSDCPLSRFAAVDSPFKKSSWDDYLTFTEIEGHLMVTFLTTNKMVMVNDTGNELEYIKTNPLDLEQTSTIRSKHQYADSGPLIIDLLDTSETGKNNLMRHVTHREAVFGSVIHSIFDAWHYEVLWTYVWTRLL
jgi:hypothetical protein